MELNINKSIKSIITVFLLMILPLLIILTGLIAEIYIAWFYILCITWFGMGMIFYSAID